MRLTNPAHKRGYNKLEIDTARNLVRDGYHWIARTPSGKLVVDKTEMLKDVDGWLGSGFSFVLACHLVPIFPDVTWHDDGPTCLDDIAYPPILDSTERRYLERVLIVEFVNRQPLCFPTFEMGTMYKGMIGGRSYTPEELRLNLEGKHD